MVKLLNKPNLKSLFSFNWLIPTHSNTQMPIMRKDSYGLVRSLVTVQSPLIKYKV
jgi:hypothetical protein